MIIGLRCLSKSLGHWPPLDPDVPGDWPLTRYVKLRVAHSPGMPGTFSRHRIQRKSLVSYPGMHHSACVMHVPWCMSGSLSRGGGENVPGISRHFTYLTRSPLAGLSRYKQTVFQQQRAGLLELKQKGQMLQTTFSNAFRWNGIANPLYKVYYLKYILQSRALV